MELLRGIIITAFLFVVVSCGGGGGGLTRDGGGTPPTPTPETTIALSISSTDISSQNPATVTATVMRGNTPVTGVVVNFSATLGVLSPNSGTALTNSSGVAEIVLTAGSVRGAGEITASLSSDSTVSASVGFNTQGDDTGTVGDINITLSLVDGDGATTDTITASKPGRIIATVNGITAPVIVTFTTTVGEIPINTAIANEGNNYQAAVDINAGGSLGAGTITASIESGESGNFLLVVGASNVLMGSGDPFVEGAAAISLSQISAGGTTAISVKIIDDEGNLFTETVDINFSSNCSSLATPTAQINSPVALINGEATSIYLAQGCEGPDNIIVTANAGGINLSATALVNVLPASVGSIEFVSASPENISILGTGSSESSTVIFRVLDTNGNPVNNQDVNFSLESEAGDVQLRTASATSNSEGLVRTVVNSGTVATPITVTATISDSNPAISTQSSQLVVSTGIPDQDSISLSFSVLNPEGWNIDGEQVEVTARLADAFNNPAPNGRVVSFTTEGGSIEPSCQTVNGACSVMWRSQFPRPEGEELTFPLCIDPDLQNIATGCADVINTMGQRFGGRATVLAYADGEESFPDLNGNGRFDASEVSSFVDGTDLSGRPFDIKEAFVDHNEDGFYNPAEAGGDNTNNSGSQEEFEDFNKDGEFSLNDGLYNGVLCSEPAHAGCAVDKSTVHINDSGVIVMSANTPFATYTADSLTVLVEGAVGFSAIFADFHNQPLPAGTVITFTVDGSASVIGNSTFTVPSTNRNGGIAYGITIKGGDEPGSAVLGISVATPSGVVTTLSSVPITVTF